MIHKNIFMKEHLGWLSMLPAVLAVLLLTGCGGDDGLKDKETTVVEINDDDDDNTTATIDDSYTYKLPVIFHVLYRDRNDPRQYVAASRLREILNNVNELYQGGIYGQSQNINVKFVLASTDEQGRALSTPGVEYVQWPSNREYPINPYDFMGDNTGAFVGYIWEPLEFINVMVYNFSDDSEDENTTLGVSHMPYSVEGNHVLEGLETVEYSTLTKRNLKFPYCSSINSLYIDQESDRYTREDKGAGGFEYCSTDVNVTIAHELGHYLGLHHMFTERNGATADDCFDSDYCEDTPSYNRVNYLSYLESYLNLHEATGEPLRLADLAKRIPCEGDIFYSANIMDYMVSLCYKFSVNQKERIRHVLYYSPLMPGPRKPDQSRSLMPSEAAPEGTVDLPIRMAVCRQRLIHHPIH